MIHAEIDTEKPETLVNIINGIILNHIPGTTTVDDEQWTIATTKNNRRGNHDDKFIRYNNITHGFDLCKQYISTFSKTFHSIVILFSHSEFDIRQIQQVDERRIESMRAA